MANDDDRVSPIRRIQGVLKDAGELTGPAFRMILAPSMTKWARRQGKWVTVGLVLCTLVVVGNIAYSVVAPDSLALGGPKVRLYAQISLLLLAATFAVTAKRENPLLKNAPSGHLDEQVLTAVESSERFMSFWPALWTTWFLLYAALTLDYIVKLNSPYLVALFDLLNNCTALIFLSMYRELRRDTTLRNKQFWVPLLLSAIFLAGVEVAVTAALIGNPLLDAWQLIFQVLSGVVVGLATALFASRLTSKIIDVPVAVVAILLFYAILQPVFPLIAEKPVGITDQAEALRAGLALLVAKLALYCKLILLALVHWLNDTGRLTYYMYGVRDLDSGASTKMFEFLNKNISRSNRTSSFQGPDPEPPAAAAAGIQ